MVSSEGSTLAMGRAQTMNLGAGAQPPSPSLSARWGQCITNSLTPPFPGECAWTMCAAEPRPQLGTRQVFLHTPHLGTGSRGSGVWVQPRQPQIHTAPP